MHVVPTFQATVCCGLRPGYADTDRVACRHFEEAVAVCRAYCDAVGLGVTVTRTEFVYAGGHEPGVLVGLINYPRFPKTPAEIRAHALALAARLKDAFRQERVSVVLTDETVMLGDVE